jgi:asparaginyl-tRNA synthetase
MTSWTIKEILAGRLEIGAPIVIEGWLRTRRDSKAGLSFLQIHDGSCFEPIQVVAESSLDNYQSQILHLTTHCSLHVEGTLCESLGKGQRFEVKADRVTVIGPVENPDSYPVSAKRHTMEHLRTVAHLRPRTNTFGAVARVRDCLAMAIHRYFHDRGFFWVHTPIISTSDAEGAGAMFRVSTLDFANLPRDEHGAIDYSKDFFGKQAGLTVSGQLNVEAYCLALSRVYTFGPTFRAENSNTTRHLAEFWMIEPEIAFADLNDDANLAEDFLKYLLRAVLDERPDDMAFFAQHIDKDCITRLETFISASFERMDYSDAIHAL